MQKDYINLKCQILTIFKDFGNISGYSRYMIIVLQRTPSSEPHIKSMVYFQEKDEN